MESTDLILGLPTELACEILGKWLQLRDLPRVDSAFCQLSKRKKLLESIFPSPLFRCKVIPHHGEESKQPLRPEDSIKWMLTKNIRAEFLTLSEDSDVPSGLEYLEQFGSWLEGICFDAAVPDEVTLQVLRLCPNLGTFFHAECSITETFITLLSGCTKLNYLILSHADDDDDAESEGATGDEGHKEHIKKHFDHLPLAPSLHPTTLILACEECSQTAILRICEPRSVQAMFVSHCSSVLDWTGAATLVCVHWACASAHMR